MTLNEQHGSGTGGSGGGVDRVTCMGVTSLGPTLSVPDAGKIVRLGRSASYTAAHMGIIPTVRVGRKLVVPTVRFLEKFGLI